MVSSGIRSDNRYDTISWSEVKDDLFDASFGRWGQLTAQNHWWEYYKHVLTHGHVCNNGDGLSTYLKIIIKSHTLAAFARTCSAPTACVSLRGCLFSSFCLSTIVTASLSHTQAHMYSLFISTFLLSRKWGNAHSLCFGSSHKCCHGVEAGPTSTI